jgi:hypothetical protein
MTPERFHSEIVKLQREIGLRAEIFVSFDTTYFNKATAENILNASVYPRGMGGKEECAFRSTARNFEDLLEKIETKWAECSARHRAEIIRKMALRIINLTAEHGECTDAALRGDVFSAGDISMYGVEACEEANRIAAKGPFSIIAIKGANAA